MRVTQNLREKLISQRMISAEGTQINSLFTASWLYHIICIVIKICFTL